jgi:hypothetical protein
MQEGQVVEARFIEILFLKALFLKVSFLEIEFISGVKCAFEIFDCASACKPRGSD